METTKVELKAKQPKRQGLCSKTPTMLKRICGFFNTWLQISNFHGEFGGWNVLGRHEPVAAPAQALKLDFKGGDGGTAIGARDPGDVDGRFRGGRDGGTVGGFGDCNEKFPQKQGSRQRNVWF